MKRILVIISLFLIQVGYAQLTAAKYTIKNIKANTKYSDYGTSYFGPNRIIFASSKLDGKKLKNKFKNSNDDFPRYDLFKGFLNYKGEINYVKKILNNFVTKYNESNVSFSPDYKYVYFTQNNIKKGKYVEDDSQWVNLKIYRASVTTSGEWSNIISLPFNNDKYSCAHPSVSEDGRILFFSSDMPGSYGNSDIYWVTINKNGTYGEPQNIGPHVNSSARENFPYVDGNILYFSSDRTESKGGLDIFMVPLDNPDATPVNLGSPINSEYDDFCFIIDRQHKKGFFSSNRPDGKGEDDIYSFIQETEIQECKQVISGEIRDRDTNELIPGAVGSMYSHNNIVFATYPTKSDGKFTFDLACRGNYRVEATQIGYKKTFRQIGFTPNLLTQNITLYLDKEKIQEETKEEMVVVEKTPEIKKEEAIKDTKPVEPEKIKSPIIFKDGKEMLDLPPIYFDLDQYYLTKEAMEILGKAVRILYDFPNISIEFGAHTDCRASDSYNLHLSDLRAKEVVNFIVAQGISKDRITGRGYGESRPVNKCIDGVKCTEAEYLQNRRTEFIIKKK
jgi:outer membrane protein OmpA-like peptidoglycan-associated protein